MDAKVPTEAVEGDDSFTPKISAKCEEEDGTICLFLSINKLSSPFVITKPARLQPSKEILSFSTK